MSKLWSGQFLNSKAFLFSSLALIVSPFLIIVAFVNPLYDDFSYSNNVLRSGFFDAQVNLYQQWAGRYFSNVLLSLNPIIWGNFTLYKIVPMVLIGLTFWSAYFFLEALLKQHLERSEQLIGAGFFTVLYLNEMPDTLDGIYWIPGSLSYHFASILTLFFLALMLRALENPQKPKILPIILSYFLNIAIVGSSETSMFFLLFIVAVITTVNFYLKSRNRWIWLGLWSLTLLCSVIVISSPGNEIRGAFFTNRHRFFYSTGMALAQEIRFLVTWLTNPAFILATILSLPIADKIVEKNELLKKHFFVHPIILTLLLLGLIFCGLFPPYWATGMLGQHRSVNVAYFFFLTGWFLLLTSCIAYFKQKGLEISVELPKFVYRLSLPLLIICLFATNNSREVVIDLMSGKALRYDQEMKKRYLEFAQCVEKNEIVCQINEVQNFPTTISRKNYFNPTSFSYEQNYWKLKLKANFN